MFCFKFFLDRGLIILLEVSLPGQEGNALSFEIRLDLRGQCLMKTSLFVSFETDSVERVAKLPVGLLELCDKYFTPLTQSHLFRA